jgi:hypothetical protein
VALTLYLAVHGCADVHGGAVELSWKLRATAGSEQTFLDCSVGVAGAGHVSYIRLDWQVNGEADFRRWPCGAYHGVTGFELPEGEALLTVSPECETQDRPPVLYSAAADTYIAPAPEQRVVIAGNTVSLGGVELLLEVSSCDKQACICQ